MRIVAAASDAGIGLTLLPVFYAHSDFGGAAPTQAQRRFIHGPDSFRALLRRLVENAPAAARRRAAQPARGHAGRAGTVVKLGHGDIVDGPIHIHAAEQRSEVDACVAWSGARPVEWLLDHAEIDARWCLVHATHMTADEARRLAVTGAVAGLCPTTEADLGDGVFPAVEYLGARGRIGIGGDSHVGVDPFAELRMIESAQRLTRERRNVLAQEGESSGLHLFPDGARRRSPSAGTTRGCDRGGRRADLVVLDSGRSGAPRAATD